MKIPYYRQALHESLSQRTAKNAKYSLRSFARYLAIEPSALSQVLNGKRFLSLQKIERILSKLDLTPTEQETFKASLAQAKKDAGHARFSGEMKSILKNSRAPSNQEKTRELSIEKFKAIADWYHYAILELTLTKNFDPNPEIIAKRLGISTSDATLAIERLLSLELLEEKAGTLKKTDLNLDTSDKHLTAPALRRRQKQILEKSIESLENDDISVRNHSAMTLAIDPTLLPEAKARIQKFMSELTQFLESGNQIKPYEMIVNLIPLEKGK